MSPKAHFVIERRASLSSNLCYANGAAQQPNIIDIVLKLKLSLQAGLSSQLTMVGFCSTLIRHLSLVCSIFLVLQL